jgi:carboxymethylenebutenolidase
MAGRPPRVTQEMIRAYDDYTHVHLDRRRFMNALAKLAGGSAAAAVIAPLIAARPAAAQMVDENDARLTTEFVTFPGASGQMLGYLAYPLEVMAGALPAVIVIHENRGLNEHTQDIARRFAIEGFTALAPDFLSPEGGTPADEELARELIGNLTPEDLTGNLLAAAQYLRERDEAREAAVAAVGFCWGGTQAARLAVADPELAAAVVFYGGQPAADDVPAIEARLLLHYAGLDERVNAGIPDFEAALQEAGVDYTLHMYEGANHAFFNDTAEARYDPEAAGLAWERTLAFLKETLGEAWQQLDPRAPISHQAPGKGARPRISRSTSAAGRVQSTRASALSILAA